MASEGSFTIPPEIITNILYRLPAKSLGRFRCVSKDWLSLISEPQFIKIHQNTHNRSHLIFVSNLHPLYSLPIHHHEAESPQEPTKIRFETDNTSIALHGSCNGLVLLTTHHDFTCFQLVVLNPTTGEFLKSQNPVMKSRTDFLEIEIMYGLGYDSVTDDYKVVIVSYFHNHGIIPPDNMSVHVHSLRTKTWKRITDSPYDHSYGMSLPGVFVNGFLHWIAKKNSDHLPVIVAFNLADENFSELPSPNFKIDCKLIALNGKLAVFMEDEVWLMNEYGVRESWTKILVLGILPKIEPMSFNYNGKVLFVKHDQIYIYDIEERSFCKSGNVSWSLKDLKVKGSYIESLMSPNYS
ncbi:hypothetical protein LXL04_025942 [Taraxacum kok-saghyz]